MSRVESRKVWIGIDPGGSGGLVALFSSGNVVAIPMPETERDIWNWFTQFQGDNTEPTAIIEKVHAMPKMGVASMFTFGEGYGGLRMALIAAGIPFQEVQPRMWQKAVGITAKGKEESKPDFKLRLRAKAQQLFPQLTMWTGKRNKGEQMAVCDALLIAFFCKRTDGIDLGG